jgi:CRP/FNR family transcriptional regulator, cyclic AMP receptor protein
MVGIKTKKSASFDVEKYLSTAGIAKEIATYDKGQSIFSQGGPCESVLYLQRGRVKLTINSSGGKEAVVALLYAGDFFGEGCIAGQSFRAATATALEPTIVTVMEKKEMIRVIHEEHEFSDRFLSHMLKRNIRVEEDLTDQLFNSCEKRLARILLLIAQYGKVEQPEAIVAKISQEMLAEMIGTTRSRVSVFMNKFRRLGYIEYNGELHINSSLLHVILHD